METINQELLSRMHDNYAQDPSARALTAAMAKTDIGELIFSPMSAAKFNGEFAIEVKTHGITAQEQSGRCWMFAAMNIVREKIIEKWNLDGLVLSGNFLEFYDKLEKANNFLESVIEYSEESMNSHRMIQLFDEGVRDGGWWVGFVDLVQKYGLVPTQAMPENYHSGHTAKLLQAFNTLVRKDAMELRRIARAEGREAAEARKEEMMIDFYKAECIAFGEPPQTFDFCYRDADKEYHADFGLTPKSFAEKYLGEDLSDYFFLGSQPTETKTYYKNYSIHDPSNMYGKNTTFLNLPIEELKELVIAQLKGGEGVWFGCDCRKGSERSKGYWDPASVDFGPILGGVDMNMSREDNLESRDSSANHDMVICGVNFGADGKPDRWKIANSWSDKWGKDGYFVASDDFFSTFVYEAAINKKYMTEEQIALAKQEPIQLLPWEV